jgi:molybdopterin-containing oxidoreductase family membrane subunit
VVPHRTPGEVTEEIAGLTERKPSRGWWAAFLLSVLLFSVGASAMLYTMVVGIGAWGVDRTVGWGFDITNFVYWIGIGHAGTLISALLFMCRQRWRTAINRAAEAMTIFAVACAAIFPLVHMGRPWYFFWLMPYPNNRGPLWVNFRSPLLWDFFAISTYFLISLVFWYLGLVPDLATLRDRAVGTDRGARLRRALYGFFSLGWNGSARAWHHYEAVYALIALLGTPLVISVSTIVGSDFATSVIPGWHVTLFPPYFVIGATYCGFAMVLALLVVLRRLMRLEAYVTAQHLNWICKFVLLGSVVMGSAYAIEFFFAWYSGNPYEATLFRNRTSGPYAWAYYTMLLCNVAVPQILWFRKARRTLWLMVLVGVLINIGMWCERFVIVVTSLYHDFLPSSWTIYHPTANEFATMAGMFGLFFALFLLFTRVLPVIPIAEIKGVLDYARPRPHDGRPEEGDRGMIGDDGDQDANRRVQNGAHAAALSLRAVPGTRRGMMPFHLSSPPSPSISTSPFALLRARIRRSSEAEPRYCIGYFASEQDLVAATREARRRGYRVLDAFTPYPVHGLADALGLRPSPLTWIGFWAGGVGLVLALALQAWTSAYNWPLRVGGQPLLAWPVFIPVAFEFIVMFACFIGLGALFARTHRWPGRWRPSLHRVTDDRFALALLETDAALDPEEQHKMLGDYGAVEVVEGDELA